MVLLRDAPVGASPPSPPARSVVAASGIGAPKGRRPVPFGAATGSGRNEPRARDARQTALAFVDSYLAVTYGQAPPDALRAASAALRAPFIHAPPHVSADVATRDPHVLSLRVEAAGATRREAAAAISDGTLSYIVTFALERQPRGWRVVDVTGG